MGLECRKPFWYGQVVQNRQIDSLARQSCIAGLIQEYLNFLHKIRNSTHLFSHITWNNIRVVSCVHPLLQKPWFKKAIIELSRRIWTFLNSPYLSGWALWSLGVKSLGRRWDPLVRSNTDIPFSSASRFISGGSTTVDTHLLTFQNIHGEIMPMMAPWQPKGSLNRTINPTNFTWMNQKV